MKIDWESKNMLWRFYFLLGREAFYVAIVLGGVDIEFHIHDLREAEVKG